MKVMCFIQIILNDNVTIYPNKYYIIKLTVTLPCNPSWRRSVVVRTLVSAGELSLSCARLLAG